jgi:hypothetical protein
MKVNCVWSYFCRGFYERYRMGPMLSICDSLIIFLSYSDGNWLWIRG